MQAENAILNLAINARDAMPEGGTLRVATRAEGTEVRLTIADSGHGMPAEVASRAFEPFYTTKELGKGTGLGLAQVYGFATQSGGAVAISSEEGVGTLIEIVLPAHVEEGLA